MVQPTAAPAPAPVQHVQPASMQYPPAPAPVPSIPVPINGTRPGERQVSDRQQVLRHQQQRLLLLRHAAKCQHDDGRCPVTPHCAGMKRLWKHIAECKDQKCLVPHCVSSRYVLSHYHRCKDVRCPVCGPVREAIHRSHEKQKQMQALKQRHQQAVQQNQSGSPPVQPGIAPSGVSLQSIVAPMQEPLAKRQRTGPPGSMQQYRPTQPQPVSAPPVAPMLSQQGLHPPSSGRPGIPGHPPKAGYMYGQPPPTTSSVAKPAPALAPGVAFTNGQMITPKYTGPKPQEDHTLINCFSVEQIETHIASLNKGLQLQPLKLKTKCLDVLKVLQGHQHGWVFNSPVDPVELGLPDYFEVIKKPMDLGTVRKKLENGCYHSLEDFERHVHVTFDNAMAYNPEGSVVYNMAKEMKVKFTADYAVLIKQLNAEEDVKRRNGEACLLCGCEKLLFEPPVFYCNGTNCPSKRIRRNSYYYVGGNNQYHWCHQCFQELKDGNTMELGDMTIRKEQLLKKKNDELHEESWVQCDRCERWVHQICALFNTRQNKDQRSEYACPRCTIEDREKKGKSEGTSSTPMAEDLQRTKLSEFLEAHVREKMDEHIKSESKRKSQVDVSVHNLWHISFRTFSILHYLISQGVSFEEARKSSEMGGAITIRQVTSVDKKLEVRDRMKKRYAFKNYPDEFSYRCKCIVVFQNLDGVDVILFGLYVYEHDEKNPAPNKRCVYVSYLDSVHYMKPRHMRTFIYHEILISYLDYVRKRGFSTAHIWACPPLKGDDYILYAKPEDQKTPKDERLRQWYIDMLIESQKRGIVGKLTNMYDLYFASKDSDATVVPYMDGDYFPAEAENIIKNIEEGKTGKKGGSQSQKKKKGGDKSKKKKSGRGGTRSTGIDEEALKASGILGEGKDQKSLEEGGRDYVMQKLGETIQPMKESFIVAFLAWEGATKEELEVPKAAQEYREKHDIKSKPEEKDDDKMDTDETAENPKEAAATEVPKEIPSGDLKEESKDETNSPDAKEVKTEAGGTTPAAPETEAASDSKAAEPAKSEETKAAKDEESDEEKKDGAVQPAADDKASAAPPSPDATPALAAASPTPAAALGAAPTPVTSSPAPAPSADLDKPKQLSLEERSGKFAAMARKRGRTEEEQKEEEEKKDDAPATTYVTDSKGRRVKVIDDDIEEMDCEFLNNRQAFLNLCQGNHYQFDQVRRAKHTSMMVLWHLHNRDAPKFVQQCTTCSREILQGYRYHCPTCADFDQCEDCVRNPKTVRHPHQLKPIPVASGQQTELTEAQREERQRSIQLHMTLLLHAATCKSAKCPSANCQKMKGLLKHGAQCQQKATGGCNVCKRIWALLQIHARQCKQSACPVPNCMAIRERVRQLKLQQQAMDDRRRQQMNSAYRMG
jgi:E1A/CREB-binding protein